MSSERLNVGSENVSHNAQHPSWRSDARLFVLSATVLAVAGAWSYWNTLRDIAAGWSDPEYSHGYLVPLFCVALLWLRRDRFDLKQLRPNWWGLPVLFGAVLARIFAAHFYVEWVDGISLLPFVAGLFLLVGGWHALKWSWPAIAFMFFMVPLPYTVEVMLREPLRRMGTVSSTFLMQTLGLPALSEGNVIVVGDFRIGVVEACSGLRMLMIFFALSTAVALLSNSALWEKVVIILSSIVIALAANIARITITGVLYLTTSSKLAELVFHDLAGWLMMPLALLLLWGELWLLKNLFTEEERRPLAPELQMAGGGSQGVEGQGTSSL